MGGYVANTPGHTNAYRVLSADGSISPNFRWYDPDDHRDVRGVLEAEGVVLDGNRASADQRVTAEELASMIEEPEEQAGEDAPLGGPDGHAAS